MHVAVRCTLHRPSHMSGLESTVPAYLHAHAPIFSAEAARNLTRARTTSALASGPLEGAIEQRRANLGGVGVGFCACECPRVARLCSDYRRSVLEPWRGHGSGAGGAVSGPPPGRPTDGSTDRPARRAAVVPAPGEMSDQYRRKALDSHGLKHTPRSETWS